MRTGLQSDSLGRQCLCELWQAGGIGQRDAQHLMTLERLVVVPQTLPELLLLVRSWLMHKATQKVVCLHEAATL